MSSDVPRMLAAVKKGNAAEEGCQLERELAAAIEQRDKAVDALKEIREVCGLALNAGQASHAWSPRPALKALAGQAAQAPE